MEPSIATDSNDLHATPGGFCDWELLFRLEIMARSLTGLFDHHRAGTGWEGDIIQSPAAGPMLVRALERLLQLACSEGAAPPTIVSGHKALCTAMLSSELGRGILLPPALQNDSERAFCHALAEASDAILDAAVAEAALKALMDPKGLLHMSTVIGSGDTDLTSPGGKLLVFLQNWEACPASG